MPLPSQHDAFRRDQRRQIALGVVLTVSIVLVGTAITAAWFVRGPVLARWRGEVDWLGRETWRDEPVASPVVIDSVDHRRVHAELVPRWLILRSRDEDAGDAAFAELGAAVATDAGLAALVEAIDADIEPGGPRDAASAIAALERWNTYVDELGSPFVLQGGLRNGVLYAKAYETVADGPVTVGDRAYRARVLRRVDTTNVVEGWLGSVSDHRNGARILLDRVEDVAYALVWPTLDPLGDTRLPARLRGQGGQLREVLSRELPAGSLAVLVATAATRGRQQAAIDAIGARAGCGNRFQVSPRLPWYGLDPADRASLHEVAWRDAREPCPAITWEEAGAFDAAFQDAVAHREALRPALRELVAVAARAVTVHEARHAADDEGPPPTCAACPAWVRGDAVFELSAYLAAFADPRSGVLAWFQACSLEPGQSLHAGVVELATAAIVEGGCTAALPPDLSDRASALERRWLGRSDPIGIPDALLDQNPGPPSTR